MLKLITQSRSIRVSEVWSAESDVTLFTGDCKELLADLPRNSIQLVVTSPPYNIGKRYERRVDLDQYLLDQRHVIHACIDKIKLGGSICWQVGNHVDAGEIFPLDVMLYQFFKEKGLRLRNRIVWRFEHGLHCSQEFSRPQARRFSAN